MEATVYTTLFAIYVGDNIMAYNHMDSLRQCSLLQLNIPKRGMKE